jgi:hypothetical protein
MELTYLYMANWEDAVAQAVARLRSEDVMAEAKLTPVNSGK